MNWAGLAAPDPVSQSDPFRFSDLCSPELNVLFLTARLRLDPANIAEIAHLLEKGLDWQLFGQLVERHRLVPLIDRNFRDLFEGTVPAALADQWRITSRSIAFQNVRLASELVRLLDHLRADGIQALPYKGPVLAAWIFGDLSLRTIYDLDLIVRHSDLAKVKEHVIALGYRPWGEALVDSPFSEESSHLIFVHSESGITIEVHWSLAPSSFPLSLRGERLWQGLSRRRFGSSEVLAHSVPDLLLILAVHAGKHHWSRLAWITDIAELIRQNPSLSWNSLIREANRHRCRRLLLVGLCLAKDLLEAPIPDSVQREWAKDKAVTAICRQVITEMGRTDPPESNRWSLQWSIRECLRDRVESAIRLAATPTEADRTFLRIPSGLHALYLPARALRLAWKYTWQRIRRDRPLSAREKLG